MKTHKKSIKKKEKNIITRNELIALPRVDASKRKPVSNVTNRNSLQRSTSGARTSAVKRSPISYSSFDSTAKQGKSIQTDRKGHLVPSNPQNNPENPENSLLPINKDNPTDIIFLPDNPDSIWRQPKFPHNTKAYQFTPAQLLSALTEFSNCTTGLSVILYNRKIERDTFYHLLRVYGEIADTYAIARKVKADKFGEAIVDLWEDLPDREELYVRDKFGKKSLSAAGTQWVRFKAESMHRMAQVHETGSFIPVSKQETFNRNLTLGVQLHGKLPDDFELNSAGPDAIINALRGGKKC